MSTYQVTPDPPYGTWDRSRPHGGPGDGGVVVSPGDGEVSVQALDGLRGTTDGGSTAGLVEDHGADSVAIASTNLPENL